MTYSMRRTLHWSSRALGILTALFLGVFALDAFGEGTGFWSALPRFAIHLLPSLVLLAVVGIAWRRAWVGGLVFLALAVLYADMARAHPLWILTIGGPLALVGALYLASWARPHAASPGG